MELKNFATFDELFEHWEIPDFELLKCIQSGLIAYDRLGKRTITEKEVIHEPVETVDEYRKRLILGESNAEQLRIEKINSAEYRYNAHRLGIELPPPEVYNYDKVLQRVESRIDREYEEYKKLESFPRVPPDRRLIPSEIDDNEAVELLNEMRTFLFYRKDVNQFAKDHSLPLIDDEIEKSNQELISIRGTDTETKNKQQRRSRSSDSRRLAVTMAQTIRNKKPQKSRADVAKEIKEKCFPGKDILVETIKGWIAAEFPKDLKKVGRQKKEIPAKV